MQHRHACPYLHDAAGKREDVGLLVVWLLQGHLWRHTEEGARLACNTERPSHCCLRVQTPQLGGDQIDTTAGRDVVKATARTRCATAVVAGQAITWDDSEGIPSVGARDRMLTCEVVADVRRQAVVQSPTQLKPRRLPRLLLCFFCAEWLKSAAGNGAELIGSQVLRAQSAVGVKAFSVVLFTSAQ